MPSRGNSRVHKGKEYQSLPLDTAPNKIPFRPQPGRCNADLHKICSPRYASFAPFFTRDKPIAPWLCAERFSRSRSSAIDEQHYHGPDRRDEGADRILFPIPPECATEEPAY